MIRLTISTLYSWDPFVYLPTFVFIHKVHLHFGPKTRRDSFQGTVPKGGSCGLLAINGEPLPIISRGP